MKTITADDSMVGGDASIRGECALDGAGKGKVAKGEEMRGKGTEKEGAGPAGP